MKLTTENMHLTQAKKVKGSGSYGIDNVTAAIISIIHFQVFFKEREII